MIARNTYTYRHAGFRTYGDQPGSLSEFEGEWLGVGAVMRSDQRCVR